MADNDMLSTDHLFQPRGPGTTWFFRFATPAVLIGRTAEKTGKPYGKAIAWTTGTRNLVEARKVRDFLLGRLRAEEARAVGLLQGDIGAALDNAPFFLGITDDYVRETVSLVLDETAERMIKAGAEPAKAFRWTQVAKGEALPFKEACERYLKEEGSGLSLSSVNNLNTAAREFREFAGEDATLQEVDRLTVGEFITVFLPARKSGKAPEGQGPATIRKKASQLSQVWAWAMKRGHLPYSRETPWDGQAPTAKVVKAAATKRHPFSPEQALKLLTAEPAGSALGDVMRVALLNGVRLEEVAGLKADQVDPQARWYSITEGKTDSAVRVVPLVAEAQEVIERRLKKAAPGGPLFPELKVRKSTEKQGGALSQAFTRLRRDTLGAETDGALAHHSWRHTWRTEARRAGVALDVIHALGGWTGGRGSDAPYDHGLEAEQYRADQQKVVDHMRARGFLPPLRQALKPGPS